MYYKVVWNGKKGGSWSYFEADSVESARDQAINTFLEDGTEMTILPIPLTEMLDEEKQTFLYHVHKLYIALHYDCDTFTVRQYAQIKRNLVTDEQKQLEMYHDINRYFNILSFIKNHCNMDAITGTEWMNATRNLWMAEGTEEYQRLIDALPKKQ